MLSLYMHEQTCITKQEQARGRLGAKEGTPWPADELWGTVPRLRAWEKVRSFLSTVIAVWQSV